MALSAKLNIKGGYAWNTSSPPSAVEAIVKSLTFVNGTGAGQANCVYKNAISLAATTRLNIDLKGGGGELDQLGVAMALTAVKLIYLNITTPAASTSLLFGPQGIANAAQLWFQAATANFYDTVLDTLLMYDSRAGWTLDATHKVLSIYNPGASTVAGTLWVFGTK